MSLQTAFYITGLIWLIVDFMEIGYVSNWELLTMQHNCTILVSACICLIEVNDAKEETN